MNQFDSLYFLKYVGEGDEILFVCHRHPILVIDNIVLWIFFGGLIPVFFYVQNTFSIQSIVPTIYFQIFLFSVYLGLLYQIFNWYNDVWVLTRRGIIDIEWNIWSGSTHYIEYHDIQGIQVETSGFVDSIFGKGDILINLHGATEQFQLSDAQDPQLISEYIQTILDEESSKHQAHHPVHHEEPVDDRQPFELLLDTLTDIVREHLEKKGTESKEDIEEKEKQIKETLKYAGTIDLRSGKPIIAVPKIQLEAGEEPVQDDHGGQHEGHHH